MAAVAGIVGGALGGGLAVTVLAPLTAANNFLGSYFFGSGMILGERQMYQDDWIKIKKRLDAGESFLVILEEVMKPNTQAVMQMARETVIAVSEEWNKIVLDYISSIPASIWNALKLLAGDISAEQDLIDEWNKEFGPGGDSDPNKIKEDNKQKQKDKDQQIKDKDNKEDIDEAIKESSIEGTFVQQYALQYNAARSAMLKATNPAGNEGVRSKNRKLFILLIKKLNQLAAVNSQPKLQIDTLKSLKARKMIPK